MSSPPFNPDATVPTDAGIVSQFPGQERTFREIVESWLLFEHGASGHHAFPSYTTAERDADTTWEVGSLIYNETTGKLQLTTSINPDVWLNVGPEFPTGTRMAFQQTTPPTGWTKETGADYNDATLRFYTGTVTDTGGTEAFSTVFTEWSELGAVDGHALTQAELPASRVFIFGDQVGSGTGNVSALTQAIRGVTSGEADENYAIQGAATEATVGRSSPLGSGSEHTHGFTPDFDISVKFVGFTIGEKD